MSQQNGLLFFGLILSIILASFMATHQATYAQCAPDGTAAANNITCTGTDPDGVGGKLVTIPSRWAAVPR